jgi:hypothetical protein
MAVSGRVTFGLVLGGSAMSDNVMESMVRQRLREKAGQVYCADCLAKDLQQDPLEVRAVMDVLAPRQHFSAGPCPCGPDGAHASLVESEDIPASLLVAHNPRASRARSLRELASAAHSPAAR